MEPDKECLGNHKHRVQQHLEAELSAGKPLPFGRYERFDQWVGEDLDVRFPDHDLNRGSDDALAIPDRVNLVEREGVARHLGDTSSKCNSFNTHPGVIKESLFVTKTTIDYGRGSTYRSIGPSNPPPLVVDVLQMC